MMAQQAISCSGGERGSLMAHTSAHVSSNRNDNMMIMFGDNDTITDDSSSQQHFDSLNGCNNCNAPDVVCQDVIGVS